MIKNKVLALVCAISMIGTMFATVVSAADPDVNLTLSIEKCDFTLDDNLDEDLNYEDDYGAPVYKLSLSVSGLAKKASVKEDGVTVAYTGTLLSSLGAFIDFDADKFTYVKGESSFGGTFVPGKVAGADQLSITWYDTSAKKEDGVVGSMYLYANSGEEVTEEVSFTLNEAKTYAYLQYWDGTSKDAVLDGSNKSTTVADGLTFVNATLNKAPAPTYTKYEVSESSDNNKGKEGSTDEFYSYGIKTTITPNSWTLNALDYKFTKDGGATYVSSKDKADDTLVGWSTPFAGESVLTFAVNVVNIPNDVVVAGSFEYDWTDPAAE